MLQFLTHTYYVYTPDDTHDDLTAEEHFVITQGTDFNAINIAARFMNTEFGEFLLQVIHSFAKYYSPEAKKDMIAAFVNERCIGSHFSVFHVMAMYGNKILKHEEEHEEAGASPNNLGNQNKSDVKQFWKLLVQNGANVNQRTPEDNNYAFRTQLTRELMSKQLLECFFDQLDALPKSMQREWLERPGSDNTAWECVMWAMMTKLNHCETLFQRMQPYVASLNMFIQVSDEILCLPTWSVALQIHVDCVYRSNAMYEPLLCKLVRFSKYPQLHNRFEYVMETAQAFLNAGADKTLRNSRFNHDVPGVTASELALKIAESQPQFYFQERDNTDQIQISNLLRLHELLK